MIRNAAEHVLGKLASRGISFLAGVLIARHFGAGDFGAFAYGLFIISYYQIVADAGTGTYGIRSTAEANHADLAARSAAIVVARLRIGLLALPVFAIAVSLFSDSSRLAWMGLLCVVAYTPLLLNVDFLQIGRQRERDLAIPRLVNAIVYLGITVVCIAANAPLFLVAGAIALGNLAGVRVQYWYVQRTFRFSMTNAMRHLWRSSRFRFDHRASLAMAFVSFGYPMLHSLDVFWLSRAAPAEELGEYSAAYRLMFVLADIYTLFGMTALSHFSATRGSTEQGWRLTPLALLVASCIAAGVALFAEPIVAITYGDGFQNSVALLRVFALVGVVYFAVVLLSNRAVAEHRQGRVFAAYLTAIGLSLLLKLVLRPADARVALLTTLGAELVLVVALALTVARTPQRVGPLTSAEK